MDNLEKRLAKLEQAKLRINLCVLVMPGDNEDAMIKRACKKARITRKAFEAARKKSGYPLVMHIEFVSPKPL